jgi:hypothetical protein
MRRRDHAPSERRPEELDRDDRPLQPEASERMHALQRSAGNRALSARLARAPDTGKPDVKQGEEEKTESSGARVTLPGIGTIPLLSVSFGGGAGGGVGGPGGGRSREGDKGPSIRELVFVSSVGDHSPLLSRAAVDGKPMEVEVILPRLRLKLTGAVVTSYSISEASGSATESWALNFESVEQTTEGGG